MRDPLCYADSGAASSFLARVTVTRCQSVRSDSRINFSSTEENRFSRSANSSPRREKCRLKNDGEVVLRFWTSKDLRARIGSMLCASFVWLSRVFTFYVLRYFGVYNTIFIFLGNSQFLPLSLATNCLATVVTPLSCFRARVPRSSARRSLSLTPRKNNMQTEQVRRAIVLENR